MKTILVVGSLALLAAAVAGCGENEQGLTGNLKPPVDYQTINQNVDPASADAGKPLAVLTEQLIADPAKFIGETVSFGSVVTEFGVGYVMFGKIKAVTDSIPGNAKVEQGAEVTGVCQGMVDGFILVTDSTIIPYCEVS